MLSLFKSSSCKTAGNQSIYKLLLLVMMFLPLQVFSQNNSITLDYVTVNPDNSITINWSYRPGITSGYVEVYRRGDDGIYGPIQRVQVPQNSYTDKSFSSHEKAYSYYIALYDTNGDEVVPSTKYAHQTIFFSYPVHDVCEGIIYLKWANYAMSTTAGTSVPVANSFRQNEIMVAYEGNDYHSVVRHDAGTTQAAIPITQSGNYCIKVQSLHQEGVIKSSSNTWCFNISFPKQPEYGYIMNVSADDQSQAANLNVFIDENAPDVFIQVERQQEGSSEFMNLNTSVANGPLITYTDLSARTAERAETYRVILLDSCRQMSVISETATSVFLQYNVLSPGVHQLQWSPYKGWPTAVAEYVIQRSDDGFNYTDIASVPPGTLEYTDDMTGLPAAEIQDEIIYRVKAVESDGNPFGFKEEAISNKVDIESSLEVFIPNAFRPGSSIPVNTIFMPRFLFYTPSRYSMTIFNRWGEQIFQTTDITQGWDGTDKGASAPSGVYSYVISFENDEGVSRQKRGAFILVR